MITEKKERLGTLIESQNQIHLTIYLVNHGDLADLKGQISESLIEAKESLASVFSEDDQKSFLRPIEVLLDDARTLKRLKGNIGLFRTKSEFRVLSLPIEVTRSSHVATSFHVKPLLRWIQWDSEFLLLGFENDSAHLYFGSQDSLRKIDTVLYPTRMSELLKSREDLGRGNLRELKELSKQVFASISNWIEQSVSTGKLKLFVAGDEYLPDRFNREANYSGAVRTPIAPFFKEESAPEIAQSVRIILRRETRTRLEHALLTFKIANEMNLAKKNIHEIAKAASQGRVKKLLVASNREYFGKLDSSTGKLTLHPFDLDHEDDDLLDDLAQCVLGSGGEVYVVKKEEIPSGRPILAIFTEEGDAAEKKVELSIRLGTQEKSAG